MPSLVEGAPPDHATFAPYGAQAPDQIVARVGAAAMGVDGGVGSAPSVLDSFVTWIAHELKQPLAAIASNAEASGRWLDRDPPDPARARRLAARIAANARRACEIIDSVQRLATLREGVRLPLDLNDQVKHARAFIRHELTGQRIALVLDLADDLPQAEGDPIQLQQVLANLLINAVQSIAQATADRRVVTVSTYLEATGSLGLSVHDSGPGIPEGALQRVFDPCFTTKPDGGGVGLTICRAIIHAHGGEIRAANPPEGGALLQVSLPPAGLY
jgi:C4-dicarboxylate-specific signal transduction histidine kinase